MSDSPHFYLPCTYRFDASLEYDIPSELIAIYSDLIQKCIGKEYQPVKLDSGPFKSIPIEKMAAEQHPTIIAKKFELKIKNEYKNYIDPNNVPNYTFVIDLSRNAKGSKTNLSLFQEQLLPRLEHLSSERMGFTNPVFFIIVETLRHTTHLYEDVDDETEEVVLSEQYILPSFHDLLQPYIVNGAVCLLGINKGATPLYSYKHYECKIIIDFSINNYFQRNTLEAFKFKLIRRNYFRYKV